MRRAVLRASLVSGVVMGLGDAVRQKIASDGPVDTASVARFALVGATLHGPYFLAGFGWIDRLRIPRVMASGSIRPVLYKTVVTQFTIFPVFVCLMYTYLGLLEGVPLRDIVREKGAAARATLGAGLLFWPPANVLNFGLVPSAYRAYYAACAGVGWNSVVSYLNAKK